MPTSMVPTNAPSNEDGFTLVELLVVIAILAVAASAVVLTMNSNEDGARREAMQLAGALAGLRDRAIIENRPMGAWVEPNAYGFETYSGGEWQELDDRPHVDTALPADTRIAAAGRTLVRFDNVGMPQAPASFRFEEEGSPPAIVDVTAHGEVAVR